MGLSIQFVYRAVSTTTPVRIPLGVLIPLLITYLLSPSTLQASSDPPKVEGALDQMI